MPESITTTSPAPRQRSPQRVAERIDEIAQRLGPSQKLPTVNELCVSLDSSRATVDLALGILEQRNIIHRRRGSGIYTPPIAKRSVLPIFMGIDPASESISPFYRLLANSLRNLTADRGLRSELFTGFTNVGDRKWFGSFNQDQFFRYFGADLILGGFHITGWGVEDDFKQRGLPVVGLSSYPAPDQYAVGINVPDFARVGVQALHQVGRSRLALIGGSSNSLKDPAPAVPGIDTIYTAFDDPTVSEIPYDQRGYQIGCELADRLRQKPGDLDGLVITDDVLARGVLIGLARNGVTLGQGRDLVVASHVNKGSSILVGFQHDLIALEIDHADIARKMFRLLDAQLAVPSDSTGSRIELVSPRALFPVTETP